MANRTTEDAVTEIIDVDENIDLAPFITTANSLVTEVCEGVGYTAARLELIERWLSAHFYAIRDPRVDSEKAGPVSQKYQYKVDLGLSVTTYGQMAMTLDTAGGLAKLNAATKSGATRKASLTFLGRVPDSTASQFD